MYSASFPVHVLVEQAWQQLIDCLGQIRMLVLKPVHGTTW